MFEALSEKLNGAFQRIDSKGRLTERDIDSALREVRMALLEADVNFRVAREFVAAVKTKVMADEALQTSLTPAQRVVKSANEELTAILTGGEHRMRPSAKLPSVVLLAGLNGAGKTTFAAKLARDLSRDMGMSAMLIAADLQRPAAIDQLETLARQVNVPIFSRRGAKNVTAMAREGVHRAAITQTAWAIVDTAGRFQVDEELMDEIEALRDAIKPAETLLVLDAMTGQEAVSVAEEFHRRISLTGLALTKMDGDARGGAALSITKVTGLPIKFLGTGERLDAIEPFYPDRLASRILGMGDVLGLIEKTESEMDEEKLIELDRKLRQSQFDLNDFLEQIHRIKRMGAINQVIDMIPGFSSARANLGAEQIEGEGLKRVEAIIGSMTPEERRRPEIIGGSRRRRIAKGSGTTPRDVNRLLNQFRQMRRMVKQMSTGRGRRNLLKMLDGLGGGGLGAR